MDQLTDEELLILYKRGREDAFDLLYERHRKGLFAYVLRMCQSRPLAEELFHDILTKVAQSAASYEPRGRFKAWLYRIAANHCLNALQSASHRAAAKIVPLVTLEAALEVGTSQGHGTLGARAAGAVNARVGDPEACAQGRETREEILTAVAALDPRYRSAFLFKELLDMTMEEIAQVMDIPLGTVKTLLHRARHLLRRRLVALAPSPARGAVEGVAR